MGLVRDIVQYFCDVRMACTMYHHERKAMKLVRYNLGLISEIDSKV
jgi:hypothetical protein